MPNGGAYESGMPYTREMYMPNEHAKHAKRGTKLERDMYHGICAYLMSSTIDVTVAFVVHAKTLQTFCLAWLV